MADFTIILPHLRNPGNNAALSLCIDMLLANTHHDFHLAITAVRDGKLYAIVNQMIDAATTDCVVYWSSDMFPCRDWDVPMYNLWLDTNALITPVLVEPGVIGMHPENYHRDFGRTPGTFQRETFESWAASKEAIVPDGRGWYAPYMISQTAFFTYGGLREDLEGDHHGFTPADVLFFDTWLADKRSILRARSWVYHLQRWSQVDEQEHEKRKL